MNKAEMRQRRIERAEQERRTVDELRLKAALKAINITGVATPSPQQEIAALEKYLYNLEKLRAELRGKYGAVRELWRLDNERKRTIEQIARIRLAMIKPEMM